MNKTKNLNEIKNYYEAELVVLATCGCNNSIIVTNELFESLPSKTN